jgi:hypothetical protein
MYYKNEWDQDCKEDFWGETRRKEEEGDLDLGGLMMWKTT